MLGNFSFCNPTKLYFGNESLNDLNRELPKYGKNVAEISGVMPNPTVDKLYEGVEIARKHQADLLLAVGGGSVCDYAKAVSVSVNCVRKTRGRNTICALRSLPARHFR